jgi:glycosyltransferase involved in cell wall biosynthesis
VWSNEQARGYARELKLPKSHFRVVPYKTNYSKASDNQCQSVGDYVFSGGNSERDYRTLFEAAQGLPIPFIVSTADSRATRDLTIPPNVTVIQAHEPHYRRVMSGARFVVVPLTKNRMRGAGEQSFLSAMWCGRPVICADDVSAPEYITNWVDGVVVPPCDPLALREAINTLWRERHIAEALGSAGRAKARALYTHEAFGKRMLEVTCFDRQLPSPES